MKSKNSSKTNSKREPFIAGFILPVLLLATFAPTMLFQADGDVIGDPVVIKEPPKVETPEQKLSRMLNAFDNENAIPGVLIVNFVEDSTLQEANAILAELNLKIDEKDVCMTGQTVDPTGEITPGATNCIKDGWFESLTAGRVLVESGQEKTIAQQLYATEGVVWVEPDYTATLDSENPSLGGSDDSWLEAPPSAGGTTVPAPVIQNTAANTIFGIQPLFLVVGVLVVGFGAYFVMKKK